MNSLLIAGLIVSVIASLLTAYGRVFRTKHALAVGVNALSNMIHHHKRDKRDHVKIKEGLMFASMEIYITDFILQLFESTICVFHLGRSSWIRPTIYITDFILQLFESTI